MAKQPSARRIIWYYDGRVEYLQNANGIGGKMTIEMVPGSGQLMKIDTVDASTPPKHAQVAGPPQWVSSDPAKIVVTPYDDGYSAHLAATLDAVGDFRITVTADGNLDPAVERLITGVLDIHVTAIDAAVAIVFIPGLVIPAPPQG